MEHVEMASLSLGRNSLSKKVLYVPHIPDMFWDAVPASKSMDCFFSWLVGVVTKRSSEQSAMACKGLEFQISILAARVVSAIEVEDMGAHTG